VVLIGTKLDKVKEDPNSRQVTEEMAQEFAANYSAPYFETSAKDGLNVTSVFDTIGYHCLAARLSSVGSPSAGPSKLMSPKDLEQQPSNTANSGSSAGKPCCIIQ
jgi:hypothetical protein